MLLWEVRPRTIIDRGNAEHRDRDLSPDSCGRCSGRCLVIEDANH